MTQNPARAEFTAASLLAIAAEYHRAALTLRRTGRPRQPLSRAPFRLAAIHAIELYLSALLIDCGHSESVVRAMGHGLAARADAAETFGLRLLKRTRQHLGRIDETQEYTSARYRCATINLSQLNRLEATLREVADRTSVLMADRRLRAAA